MLCGLSNYSTPSLASPASRSPRARLGQHEHWSTPSNLEGSMHKQSAGVQLHLCLLAPQAPPAPCHCSLTPGTCPHALHQNPRRLPAAPVGNTSGRMAENMHMVALPRAPETLPLSLPETRTRDPWEYLASHTNRNNHAPYVASRHRALTQAQN